MKGRRLQYPYLEPPLQPPPIPRSRCRREYRLIREPWVRTVCAEPHGFVVGWKDFYDGREGNKGKSVVPFALVTCIAPFVAIRDLTRLLSRKRIAFVASLGGG